MSSTYSFLATPAIREKVINELSAKGIPSHTPCLKLEILHADAKSYSMDAEDARPLFEKFGEVRSLRTLGSILLVLYKDVTSAYFAQKILHNKRMKEHGITLQVTWYHNQEENTPPLTNKSTAPAKFTCRFDIQIENDRKFQVARKLIGAKGYNMKKIVKACCLGMSGQAHNIVKLRLRGKGSGFKEGPSKTECEEPLHICISSKYIEKYAIAVAEIEKLIANVYREYSEYCVSCGHQDPCLLIKRAENNYVKDKEGTFDEKKVAELIDVRNEARRQCNFSEADRIREILRGKGIALVDERGGRGKAGEVTTWKYWSN